jgi:hypothetical protein
MEEVQCMQNADVISLRREYNALILVADGLIDMIHRHAACNVQTFSRMAQEARSAAHKIASMIERLLIGTPVSTPAPAPRREPAPKRESAIKRVFDRLKEVILAMVA